MEERRIRLPHDKTPPPEIPSGGGSGKDHLEELLDEALTESFPASDPIAVDPIAEGKPKAEGPGVNLDALAQEILATRADAIIEADSQGIIQFWNPGAERIFGFSRTEAVGQSLDIIIPERLRKRHWDGFDRSMKTGQTRMARLMSSQCQRFERTRLRFRSSLLLSFCAIAQETSSALLPCYGMSLRDSRKCGRCDARSPLPQHSLCVSAPSERRPEERDGAANELYGRRSGRIGGIA